VDKVLALEIQKAVSGLSEQSKLQLELGQAIYLGEETRKNWAGNLPFYLFLCQSCGRYAKDYPHGWPNNQYLRCPFCDTSYDFFPDLKLLIKRA